MTGSHNTHVTCLWLARSWMVCGLTWPVPQSTVILLPTVPWIELINFFCLVVFAAYAVPLVLLIPELNRFYHLGLVQTVVVRAASFKGKGVLWEHPVIKIRACIAGLGLLTAQQLVGSKVRMNESKNSRLVPILGSRTTLDTNMIYIYI